VQTFPHDNRLHHEHSEQRSFQYKTTAGTPSVNALATTNNFATFAADVLMPLA